MTSALSLLNNLLFFKQRSFSYQLLCGYHSTLYSSISLLFTAVVVIPLLSWLIPLILWVVIFFKEATAVTLLSFTSLFLRIIFTIFRTLSLSIIWVYYLLLRVPTIVLQHYLFPNSLLRPLITIATVASQLK